MGWKFHPKGTCGPDSVATWDYDDNHGGSGFARKIKGKRKGRRMSCEYHVTVRGNGYTTGLSVNGTANTLDEARLEMLRAIAIHRRELATFAEQDVRNFEHDIEDAKKDVTL